MALRADYIVYDHRSKIYVTLVPMSELLFTGLLTSAVRLGTSRHSDGNGDKVNLLNLPHIPESALVYLIEHFFPPRSQTLFRLFTALIYNLDNNETTHGSM